LDLGPRPFTEQHPVAFLDVERYYFTCLVAGARADGDDLALHGLFLRRVRDDDAAGGLVILFDGLDQDAVMQWPEVHARSHYVRVKRPRSLPRTGRGRLLALALNECQEI